MILPVEVKSLLHNSPKYKKRGEKGRIVTCHLLEKNKAHICVILGHLGVVVGSSENFLVDSKNHKKVRASKS